jgi:hypothetical protein
MNTPDNEPPKVEIKDGKIVHDGRTWSPHTLGVTFVVGSLSVGRSVSEYSETDDFTTSLNGEATVECQGLLVIGKHTGGIRAVKFSIQAAETEWLAQSVEGIPELREGKLPSRVNFGHSSGDAELNIAASFYVSVYLPQPLFETLLAEARGARLTSFWISARFEGLYADFSWGQTEDTRLGLAPDRYLSEAHGRVDHINFSERSLRLVSPPWSAEGRNAAYEAEIAAEGAREAPDRTPPEMPEPRGPEPSLVRVESLLSQIATATRWVGWGLLALAVVVALHLR